MTLDEAKAAYKHAKWEFAKAYRARYEPGPVPTESDALDAAVRDVALAVWYATVAPPSNSLSMAAVAENIDRLFGDK